MQISVTKSLWEKSSTYIKFPTSWIPIEVTGFYPQKLAEQ